MGIGNDKTQITPELYTAIVEVVKQQICNMNTMMPGRVVSYDKSKNTGVVQPTLQIKFVDQEAAEDRPTLSEVPFCWPRMGKAHLRFPVQPNDEGMILFSQRSIDLWQAKGGVVDPLDNRKFDYSDAVFYPGLSSDPNKPSFVADDANAELVNDQMVIEMLPDGKISIRNGTGDLITQLETAFKLLGVEPLLAGAGVYSTVATFLGSLKK